MVQAECCQPQSDNEAGLPWLLVSEAWRISIERHGTVRYASPRYASTLMFDSNWEDMSFEPTILTCLWNGNQSFMKLYYLQVFFAPDSENLEWSVVLKADS